MATKLNYRFSKNYTENGEKYIMEVCASLNDDCNNHHHDFSITADIYEIARNGRKVFAACGCCHDEIAKHCKELAKFIPLHLSNFAGQPMYAVDNGIYFINVEGVETACRALRISESECNQLKPAAALNDKGYFKYLLFSLGIVERWEKEAREFITYLESKTGATWTNPYTDPRGVVTMSDEERTEIKTRILTGYYSPASITARIDDEKRAANEKIRAEVLEKYNAVVSKAAKTRDIMLALIDAGVSLKNVIYYDHSQKLGYNWKSWEPKLTADEIATLSGVVAKFDGVTLSDESKK